LKSFYTTISQKLPCNANPCIRRKVLVSWLLNTRPEMTSRGGGERNVSIYSFKKVRTI